MSTTTLRPNARGQSSGSILLTGGATSNAVTSDNSDASYMRGSANGNWINTHFDDLTLAATERARGVTIRERGAKDSTGGNTQDVLLRYGRTPESGGGIVYRGGFTVKRSSTTPSTVTDRQYTGSPDQIAWTDDVINSTVVQLTWYKPTTGALGFQRVHELYLDVEINQQPTVTGAPTVTGYTNSATPTVSWTFSQADGYPQTWYWVKIFDAATIAGLGFDPDTTTAKFETDLVMSSTDNVQSEPLTNGVSYTAYVKVGIDWTGNPDTVYWSEWATSAPFTPTFTPPPAPVINSVTVLSDPNQYRAVINLDAPVNLLNDYDASFEIPATTSFVADANMGTPTVVTTDHLDGTQALRLRSSAAGNMVARLDVGGGVLAAAVDVGETVTVIASFKAATAARSCSVGLRYLSMTGATVGADVYSADVTDATGAVGTNWTKATLATTVPAGAAFVKVLLRVKSTAAANEDHYVDQVDLHQGSSTTFSPGGFANDGNVLGDVLLERGEKVDPRRGLAENWFPLQVASAGTELQSAALGGFAWDPTDRAQFMWLDKTIPSPGYTPAGMIRWTPIVAANQPLAIGWSNDFTMPETYAAPLVPGQTHVLSLWAWTDTGTFVVQPRISWRDELGTAVSETSGSNVTLTTTPQQLVLTGSAPATGVYARGMLYNPNSTNTKHVFLTRCGFGLGTTAVDGKQAAGSDTVWAAVRFPYGEENGNPPGWVSGQREIYADYDYPPARPVFYRASISYAIAAGTVTSPTSDWVLAYGAAPTVTMLRSVIDPTIQVAVNRRKQAGFTHNDDATVLHPLGANGAPIRLRDWYGGEDGQLIVITSTDAQRARLDRLLLSNDTMCLQWAQGGRTYVQITDRSLDETLSSDSDFCDAEGFTNTWIRFEVHTLSYLETRLIDLPTTFGGGHQFTPLGA